MAYFKFDNHNIYYNTQGKGSPLLLLHGNSVSSAMFDTEIDFYSEYFQVLYFDYLGCGNSDRIDKFNTNFWKFNAETALELINLLELDKVKIIGTSGGALTALNLAAMAEGKIQSIIADSFFGYYVTRDEAEFIRKRNIKAKTNILSKAFWEKMHGNDWEKIVDLDTELILENAYQEEKLIFGDLTKIQIPVMLTASNADELIPDIINRTGEVAADLVNSKCFFSESDKHPLMITNKPLFRELALNFFEEVSV